MSLLAIANHLKEEQGEMPGSKKRAGQDALLQKLCRPYLPANLDLILMAG
jgi:hypothetical protein